jgi:hypothetical protein
LGREVPVSVGVVQVILKDSGNIFRLLKNGWSEVLVTLHYKKVIGFVE